MAFGFEINDSLGQAIWTQSNVGLQVVHEQVLTSEYTTVTFDVGETIAGGFIYVYFNWRSRDGVPQNVRSYTDQTDWANFDGTMTLSVRTWKSGFSSNYNMKLWVWAGDQASFTASSGGV